MRKLQLQEGIPQEVRKARIDMLAGNVGKVLKEHNLEACIIEGKPFICDDYRNDVTSAISSLHNVTPAGKRMSATGVD